MNSKLLKSKWYKYKNSFTYTNNINGIEELSKELNEIDSFKTKSSIKISYKIRKYTKNNTIKVFLYYKLN
jgi:hypothetical protein